MRQKGQTLVEFAFVVPILIFLFLSIMYLGIMFMEYLQYSNAARDAARDIATQYNESGSSQFAKSAHQLRTALALRAMRPLVSKVLTQNRCSNSSVG